MVVDFSYFLTICSAGYTLKKVWQLWEVCRRMLASCIYEKTQKQTTAKFLCRSSDIICPPTRQKWTQKLNLPSPLDLLYASEMMCVFELFLEKLHDLHYPWNHVASVRITDHAVWCSPEIFRFLYMSILGLNLKAFNPKYECFLPWIKGINYFPQWIRS